MTDETAREVEANGAPFQHSRRTLVRLLGSAIALGAISESASASRGGAHDTRRSCGGQRGTSGDSFEVTGLSLTDNTFHLDRLRFAPTVDGHQTELFTVTGFEAAVDTSAVTEMDVDSIHLHRDVERFVLQVVGALARGHSPDGSNTQTDGSNRSIDVVRAYLDQVDTRRFERLQATMKRDGVADTIEHRLRHTPGAEGDAGAYVLILVLFILLVIIGAGFGLGHPPSHH